MIMRSHQKWPLHIVSLPSFPNVQKILKRYLAMTHLSRVHTKVEKNLSSYYNILASNIAHWIQKNAQSSSIFEIRDYNEGHRLNFIIKGIQVLHWKYVNLLVSRVFSSFPHNSWNKNTVNYDRERARIVH